MFKSGSFSKVSTQLSEETVHRGPWTVKLDFVYDKKNALIRNVSQTEETPRHLNKAYLPDHIPVLL